MGLPGSQIYPVEIAVKGRAPHVVQACFQGLNPRPVRQVQRSHHPVLGSRREVGARGEIIVSEAWPGFTWWSDEELMKKTHADQYAVAVDNLEFPLACFLIGAEQYCYFCYTWGWLPEYGTFDWYPEFDKPLGAPKGDAVQNGWIFRREFEHASVFVDVEKRLGTIDWK